LVTGAFGSAAGVRILAVPVGDVCTSLLGPSSSANIENLIEKYFYFKVIYLFVEDQF
jgi:hypothetical protein